MTSDGRLAVVAVGGNSLITDAEHVAIPFQAETAAVTAGYGVYKQKQLFARIERDVGTFLAGKS